MNKADGFDLDGVLAMSSDEFAEGVQPRASEMIGGLQQIFEFLAVRQRLIQVVGYPYRGLQVTCRNLFEMDGDAARVHGVARIQPCENVDVVHASHFRRPRWGNEGPRVGSRRAAWNVNLHALKRHRGVFIGLNKNRKKPSAHLAVPVRGSTLPIPVPPRAGSPQDWNLFWMAQASANFLRMHEETRRITPRAGRANNGLSMQGCCSRIDRVECRLTTAFRFVRGTFRCSEISARSLFSSWLLWIGKCGDDRHTTFFVGANEVLGLRPSLPAFLSYLVNSDDLPLTIGSKPDCTFHNPPLGIFL